MTDRKKKRECSRRGGGGHDGLSTAFCTNVSHGDTGYHREAGQQAIVATKATTQSILNQIGPKKMISIQNG